MDDAFVAADCAVRQLWARVIDAVWRQDGEAYAACFTETGEWHIAGMVFTGRPALVDACAKLLGRCSMIQLMPQPTLLTVDGDSAAGRTPVVEYAKMLDGTPVLTIGIYYDRFRRVDGTWLFDWRHWSMRYRGPLDMSAELFDMPDYGAFPGMPARDAATFTTLKKV